MPVELGPNYFMQDNMENHEVKTPDRLPGGWQWRELIPYSKNEAVFNAGVIDVEGTRLMVVRKVDMNGVQRGKPDKGNVGIYQLTDDGAQEIDQLNIYHPEVSNWEDARVFVSDKGKIIVGLTAIRKDDDHPVVATVEGEVIDGKFSLKEGTLHVYFDKEGKNMAPTSLDEVLYRPDGSKHTLTKAKHGIDENGQAKLEEIKIIQFPERDWCKWSIGTQAQFLPGGILPIHGVNKFSLGVDPKTGEEVFAHTYSLGFTQLDKDDNVIKITDLPWLTRESFKNILPMGTELDDNKDVIYCCGYYVRGNVVRFIVNIGDLMTAEVSISLPEIQDMLDKSSPIALEEIPYKVAA